MSDSKMLIKFITNYFLIGEISFNIVVANLICLTY